jgi:hypothetical protein
MGLSHAFYIGDGGGVPAHFVNGRLTPIYDTPLARAITDAPIARQSIDDSPLPLTTSEGVQFSALAYSGEHFQLGESNRRAIFCLQTLTWEYPLFAYYSHDRSQRAGIVRRIDVTGAGLIIAGMLFPGDEGFPAANMIVDHAHDGGVWQISPSHGNVAFGGECARAGERINGRTVPDGIIVYRQAQLLEFSFVYSSMMPGSFVQF